jgi:hypothetical protein
VCFFLAYQICVTKSIDPYSCAAITQQLDFFIHRRMRVDPVFRGGITRLQRFLQANKTNVRLIKRQF